MPEIITHYSQDAKIGEIIGKAMDQDVMSPVVPNSLRSVNYGALFPAILCILDDEQKQELIKMARAMLPNEGIDFMEMTEFTHKNFAKQKPGSEISLWAGMVSDGSTAQPVILINKGDHRCKILLTVEEAEQLCNEILANIIGHGRDGMV